MTVHRVASTRALKCATFSFDAEEEPTVATANRIAIHIYINRLLCRGIMESDEEGHMVVWTFLVFIAIFFLLYVNSDEEEDTYRGANTGWEQEDVLDDIDPLL